MFEVLGALQFSNLLAFGALLATPLLAFAYLRKRSSKTQVVSSLLILQTLTHKKLVQRKFKPPLRFFFELLALILLICAASYPSLKENGKRYAILIDTSMSMRAKESSGSRIELAKKEIIKKIDESPSSQLYTLYVSSPKLEQIGEAHQDSSVLVSSLSSVAPSLSNDTLDTSALELANSGRFDGVWVFTDKSNNVSVDLLGSARKSSLSTELSVVTIGAPLSNFFISDIRYSATGDKPSISCNIGASGNMISGSFGAIGLELYEIDPKSGSQRLLKKKQLTLSSQNTETSFDLPSVDTGEHIYRLALNTRGTVGRNSLLEDDSAWISTSKAGRDSVLLVSNETAASLGLDNLRSLTSRLIKPEDYGSLSKSDLKKYELLIFHRSAPASLPPVASLLVLPPEANTIFPSRLEAERPKVTSWSSDHPLTSYIKVPLLSPQASVIFETPIWAQSIINVEQGSILGAGEQRGIRYAAIGMEVFPFEGAKTPTTSILFLNALNWLSNSKGLSSSALTGSSTRLDAGAVWTVTKPNGEEEKIDVPSGNEATFYPLPLAGIYSFRDQNGTSEIHAVNNFYPLESSTFTRGSLILPADLKREAVVEDSTQVLWPMAIILALVLLLFEMALRLRSSEVEVAA
jgi:hypothetical protein